MVLKKLRLKIIDRYDSQIAAARVIGVCEARLSKILHGHVDPTPDERAKLIAAFGAGALKPSANRGQSGAAAEVLHD